jgi:hypothetical protein
MPPGYRFDWDANAIAAAVLSKSTWAVLALTLQIEVFVQVHYRESIDPDGSLSALFKDIFLYHWKEESQHVILDSLELRRVDAALTAEARDTAVNELLDLVAAVDGILQSQAKADGDYFAATCRRMLRADQIADVERLLRKAYRWQYIQSGMRHSSFKQVIDSLTTPDQQARIAAVLDRLRD